MVVYAITRSRPHHRTTASMPRGLGDWEELRPGGILGHGAQNTRIIISGSKSTLVDQ